MTARASGPIPARVTSELELETLIGRARSGGDPDAALLVLSVYEQAIRAGEPGPPIVERYLATAFREMLDAGDRDLRRPLGLVRKGAGRPQRALSDSDPLTPDAKDELRQDVWDRLARGESQRDIVRTLAAIPTVPAKYPCDRTISDIVREAKSAPRCRDELVGMGADPYRVEEMVSAEYGVDVNLVRRVLSRLDGAWANDG